MNKDIRVCTTFFRHRKTLRLKKILGLQGVISLLTLWAYAAESCPKGIFRTDETEEMSIGAEWPNEPQLFIDTLAELGFIEITKKGIELHDWKTHNPYAFFADVRSEKARKLAQKRWDRPDAQRIAKGISKSDAPNPTPIPSPNPTPKSSIKKKEYGDFTLLFETEYEKLKEKIGEDKTQDYITRMNDYLEQLEFQKKGSGVKKYASHYKAILNWLAKDSPTKEAVSIPKQPTPENIAWGITQHKALEAFKQNRGLLI